MFQHISLLGTYVNVEQWSVNKMKNPYDILFPAPVQIIYHKNKLWYSSTKSVISIMIAIKGKYVHWADIMFKFYRNQHYICIIFIILSTKLVKWTTS
jgi:hypothetical protein